MSYRDILFLILKIFQDFLIKARDEGYGLRDVIDQIDRFRHNGGEGAVNQKWVAPFIRQVGMACWKHFPETPAKTDEKIAIFNTTAALPVKDVATGMYEVSDELIKLSNDGYTILVVSTRSSLCAETDGALYDHVPEARIFLNTREDEFATASSGGTINAWLNAINYIERKLEVDIRLDVDLRFGPDNRCKSCWQAIAAVVQRHNIRFYGS